MAADLPELSLVLSPPAVSRSDTDYPTLVKLLEEINCNELHRFDNQFIKGLENELSKIQTFKRELPLSFLLLTHVIGKLKEEAQMLRDRRNESKLEKPSGAKLGIDLFAKKTWMSSAQLWSLRGGNRDDGENREWKPCKSGRDAGAFPSMVEFSGLFPMEEEKEKGTVTPGAEPGSIRTGTAGSVCKTGLGQVRPLKNQLPYQTGKKPRRCWSAELHRRFVEALEKLGGSQVATPKQIREVMRVDGLTNDEVKSHLQKYRIHVQKLPEGSRPDPSSFGKHGLESGNLKMDLLQTSSPKGPLHLEGYRKCISSNMEDEDDEDNNRDNNISYMYS